MIRYALAIVCNDSAKLLGLVSGLAFAALLITQQAAIFLGLVEQTAGFIPDLGQADVWVMDPRVRHIEQPLTLRERDLTRVRSVPGVDWASPLDRHVLSVRTVGGGATLCNVIGIDYGAPVGAPTRLVSGSLAGLRDPDAVLVDAAAAAGMMAPTVDGGSRPLAIGDELTIGGRRAVVAGTFHSTPSFFWHPLVCTTRERLAAFAAPSTQHINFVLAKAQSGIAPTDLARRITARTGLTAYTNEEFRHASAGFVLVQTPLVANFGVAVLLGFVVGAAIAGQTFHAFVLNHLKELAAFKAMGAGSHRLVAMLLVQAGFVGCLGYGIGVGAAALIGQVIGDGLAFKLDLRLLLITAVAIGAMCAMGAISGARRVMRLQPATVFRG